jgi:hypothetical protein
MLGVKIGDKHTYNDWGLKWEDINISFPTAKTNYIDIPGADGQLDLSEALTGDIKYDNRKIKLTFNLNSDYNKWNSIISEISNYLHGRKLKIISDLDVGFYYYGRLEIDVDKTNIVYGEVVINADVGPYKYELYSSLENWLWNTFNFEGGIIREYKDLVVKDTLVLNIAGRRKKIIPTFITNSIMAVKFNNVTYELPVGSTQVLDIELVEGDNILTFTGNGTVSIDYRGGSL